MATTTTTASSDRGELTPRQEIDQLQMRYRKLDEKRIRVEENLNRAEEDLEKLKQEAIRDYGTDDLDALRQKLEEMKAENERRRAKYQRHLERLEERLAAVETGFEDKKEEQQGDDT